jgi:hypothetical protein
VTRAAATPARELLLAARELAERPSVETRGLWPRAAVLLARQSLEVALKTYWSAMAAGVEESPMKAQLLCLGSWLSNEGLGRRAHQVWSVLSNASHHHPYDLTPTRDEIEGWCETVQEIIDATECAWRR